ncbi:cytochrome p450 83b1 [Phtheirospermum japonicum]|uniref:Cytochrome p450 83b1 n=1 Tax=Phtheirospermum japonicum TaxID=374723 RepID=A0A830BAQ3_9LAMI|nr:cytochrome p450 83b1 [Phtheirospermum japonicum]
MLLLFFLLSLPIVIWLYFLHVNGKPVRNLVPPGPPGLPLIGNLHQLATAKNIHIYLRQVSTKHGPLVHMKLGSKPLLVISSVKLAKEVLRTQDLAFCSRPKHLGQQRLCYNGLDIVFSPYNDYWKEVRKIAVVNLFTPQKVQSFRPVREDEISRMVTKILGFCNRVVDLSEMATALGSNLICRIAFGKRYDEHGSEMRRFDELELIDEHVHRKKEAERADDILDILIKLKEHKSCSIDLNWDNIKALLLDIFVAGTHSTSTTIVWAMTALMKAPKVMEKAQSEIRNLIGERRKVDEDDLHKLPYLKAIINETLRLYPPVPLLVPRETIDKCTLQGYEIQPKTAVYVIAWAIARDPEYWQNPDEFMPERFLNNNIDIKGQDFEVIPFGSGRRICPGMYMGLANVELTVANLLYSFDWELPPGIEAKDVDTDALPGVAIRKKNALFLVPNMYAM